MRQLVAGDMYNVPRSVALKAYSLILESLDTPVSLSVALQMKYSEWDDLAHRTIDPKDYQCPVRFSADYQAVKGLQKADFLETSFDREISALKKFEETEVACKRTNRMFDFIDYEGGAEVLALEDPEMWSVLSKARHLISKILGKIPKSVESDMRFGPGATSLISRGITLPKKYSRKVDLTMHLLPHILDIAGPVWVQQLREVEVVVGSRLSFVPKDAKTHRSIMIEPHLNVYAQLGIGQLISDRFKSYLGFDWKRFGPGLNGCLAGLARDWRLATVDLSSASDTIARRLVQTLLPEDWFELLDKTRSHFTTMPDGKVIELEKFSSMGNGFTFELETIIFYALTIASGSSRALTSVFGDDIICEYACTDTLLRVLGFCGFTVNREKTFIRGEFFESCGEDFFSGVRVTPFRWKKLGIDIKEDPESIPWFKYMNDVSRHAAKGKLYRRREYKNVFNYLGSQIPRSLLKCQIPLGYGDVGVISEFDEVCPNRLRGDYEGWDGFSTKALKFLPKVELYRGDMRGLMAALDRGGLQSEAAIRGEGGYYIGSLKTFGSWDSLGPWN